MASYLCVKMNSSATKSYNIKSSANKPYLRVDTGFIPLTTATATGPKVMVRAGGVNYRLADFITTTTAITTNTSYLTSQKTTGTSYQTASRASTSSTGYESRVSTSVTTYYTRASTSATTYYTRASTSATTYYTRKSTSATTYYTRMSTSATGYKYRTDTTYNLFSNTFTFNSNITSSTGTNSGILAEAENRAGRHDFNAIYNSAVFLKITSNSKVTTSFIYPINSAQSSTSVLKTTKSNWASVTLKRTNIAGPSCFYLSGAGEYISIPITNISRNNYTHTIKFVIPLSLSSRNSINSYTQKWNDSVTVTAMHETRYDNNNSFIVSYTFSATKSDWGAILDTEANKYQFITPNNTYTTLFYIKQTFITATTYATRKSTSTTSYLTRQSTSTTSYLTRASTSTTSYLTRQSTSATSYLTRSSISNTTYATRSSQYTSNTVYLTQSETYQTSYITTSAETTIEG